MTKDLKKEVGREEGKKQRDIAIVQSMKNKGFDNVTIAEITGLTLTEIKSI